MWALLCFESGPRETSFEFLPGARGRLSTWLSQEAISGQERAPDNKVIKFYSINNFIRLLFTLTIFTRDVDLYFYWKEVPGFVTNNLIRTGLNRKSWPGTILLPR